MLLILKVEKTTIVGHLGYPLGKILKIDGTIIVIKSTIFKEDTIFAQN